MKTAVVVVVLVAVGCASPQNASKPGIGTVRPDLAGVGTGGKGDGDVDLGSGGGGSGGAPDLAQPAAPPDLAMTTPPDLAQPAAPPDLATAACVKNVPSSTCGIFPQCGCPAGQNCNVENTGTGQALCAPPGATPNWNNCTGNGDNQCPVGSSCVDGVCSPFCSANADCPGANRECVQVVDGNNNNIPGFKVCTLYCDPSSPQTATGGYAACGPNTHCFPATDHDPFCLGPAAASGGAQGANCADATGLNPDQSKCAAPFACVSSSPIGPFTCYHYCHVGATGQCSGMGSCNSFGTKLYSGAQEIGYCN